MYNIYSYQHNSLVPLILPQFSAAFTNIVFKIFFYFLQVVINFYFCEILEVRAIRRISGTYQFALLVRVTTLYPKCVIKSFNVCDCRYKMCINLYNVKKIPSVFVLNTENYASAMKTVIFLYYLCFKL